MPRCREHYSTRHLAFASGTHAPHRRARHLPHPAHQGWRRSCGDRPSSACACGRSLHAVCPPVSTAPPPHPTATTTHGASSSQSGGIDTQRPPGAPGARPTTSAPQSSGAPAPPLLQQAGPHTTPLKRKWMLHDELYAALPDHVYTALDACRRGLRPPTHGAMLQAARSLQEVLFHGPLRR
jgi:hypothetical protein